jgi:hypothetical protein
MTENTKDIEGVLAEIAKQETRGNERVKATGEVFTPMPLVKQVVANLPIEKLKDPQSTHLDPSCGDGNFLVELVNVLSQYHDRDHVLDHMVYGIDIMPDNIHTARTRLGLTPERNGWNHIVCADFLAYDTNSFRTYKDLQLKQTLNLMGMLWDVEDIDWTDKNFDVCFRQGEAEITITEELLFEGDIPTLEDVVFLLAGILRDETKGVIDIKGEDPAVVAFRLLLSEVPPNGITFEVKRGSRVLLENPVSDPNDDGDDPS